MGTPRQINTTSEFFKITKTLSTHGSQSLSACTYSSIEAATNVYDHFMEFYDGDFGKVAESFMFGMMASTLVFRDISMSVAEHNAQ